MSILSFPTRGNWGSSQWRGNCSGFIYKDLFERIKPKTFVDPMCGSGTSIAVAKEMGIHATGLDLHSGFNALKDSILERVGDEVDFCFSHPPYLDMVVYSGEVWGNEAVPGDLSRCESDEDFFDKLQLVLMNQRHATKPGAFYGCLIGDLRRDGRYVSAQAECISRLPSTELTSVLIKAQHNTQSSRRTYGKLMFGPIQHEYILLWKRSELPLFMLLKSVATQAQTRLTGIWKNVVHQALIELGGKADLKSIYEMVEKRCDRVAANSHWREKCRQILNQNNDRFRSIERGVWALV